MSRYKFNGVDVMQAYNLIVERGIDGQLLMMPPLKDNGLSMNWADENGTDRYLGDRKFESRTINVACTMECNSAEELMQKYEALQSFLLTTGEFNFDDILKGRRWKVFYNRMVSLVRIGNSVRFTIELIDDYPGEIFTI